MRLLAPLIIEPNIDENTTHKVRTTVRGIITDGTKVLMVYSPTFNDYTFPGGGKKEHEDHNTALLRELKEELGAHDVFDINPFGMLKELRHGLNKNGQTYEQTSYYYTCKINGLGEQSLAQREQIHGVIPTWVEISEAIEKNKSVMNDHHHTVPGMKTVMIREQIVLEKLLEAIK